MIARPRIYHVNGVAYMHDPSRSKILSLNRQTLLAGRYSRTVSNEFLRISDGIPGTIGCVPLRLDATLVGVSVSVESPVSWSLRIFKNADVTPFYTLPLTGYIHTNPNLNLDLAANDVLRVFAFGSNIKMPIVELEYAYRLIV